MSILFCLENKDKNTRVRDKIHQMEENVKYLRNMTMLTEVDSSPNEINRKMQ